MKKSKALSPLEELKLDKRISKFLADIRNGVMSIDSENLIQEMERIHGSRMIRHIQSDVLFGVHSRKKLDEAYLQNQANRSRIAEIQASALYRRSMIQKRRSRVESYLKSAYQDLLYKTGKTQADRDNLIRRLLSPVIDALYDLEMVEEYSAILIKDIDEARWVIQGLKASHESELRESR